MRSAALCLLVAGICLTATTAVSSGRGAGVSCDNELQDLKTLSDQARTHVYMRPQTTTIAAINARAMPRSTPNRRGGGFERRVWRVVAEITEYRLEPTGTIHLILFDKGVYMIAEMPAAACVPPTALARNAIIRTRQVFESRCGAATSQWRSLGAVVYIDGVGFWGVPHGQKGHARNYAELQPVTRMRFVAGCA
jgi:hypothetical protein